jgi:hypothetical protein
VLSTVAQAAMVMKVDVRSVVRRRWMGECEVANLSWNGLKAHESWQASSGNFLASGHLVTGFCISARYNYPTAVQME